MGNNITFVIFTKNEEKRIGYVVRNFIKYGEVLVFDDSSTDKTAEIVRAAGGQYIIRPKSEDVHVERQEMYDFIKTHLKTDWVYWGCADNMASKSLLDKIMEVVKEGKIKYVRAPLYTYLYGNTKTPMFKGYAPMFFMKDYVDFTDNIIHGMGKFLGKENEILTLPSCEKYAIRHYSLYDMKKFVLGHLRYAEAEAQSKFNRGKKFSLFLMLGAMVRYFALFYKFSFKSGIKGLIMALMYSYFRLMVYAKLYEMENKISLESIEADFIKSKENILKEIE